MSNPNKAKGTAHETAIRNELRDLGFDIERLPLNGTDDEGDLVIKAGEFRIVLEAKNTAKIDLASFTRQAVQEADNYASNRPGVTRDRTLGLAVIKRRGKGVLDSYVATTLRELLGLGPDGLA